MGAAIKHWDYWRGVGAVCLLGLTGAMAGQAQNASAANSPALPQSATQTPAQPTPDAQKLLDAGNEEAKANHWQQARDAFEQALTKARSVNDKAGEAKALNNIGNTYANTGELTKARGYYEQAAPVFRAAGDKLGEAKALNNIGQVYTYTGEPTKALDYCQQALKICRAIGDKANEANTLNSIGNVYTSIGRSAKALNFFQEALPLFRDTHNKSGEAQALGNLGVTCNRIGEPTRALGFYQQALSIFRALGDKSDEATTLLNIGATYADIGQYAKALDFYRQARPVFRAVHDTTGEATILHNSGNVYANTGQIAKALDAYQQALLLYRANRDKANEAITLNSIGNAFTKTGRYARALTAYQQTLPVFRVLKDKANEALALTGIGFVYNHTGEPAKALNAYQQALSLFRVTGDKASEVTALTNLGDFYARHNRLKESKSALREGIAELEALRHNLEALTDAKIVLTESYLGTYQDYLDLLIREKRSGDAFALAQQTKARSLLDLLANGKADLTTRLSDAERKQLATLRAHSDTLNKKMIAEGVNNEVGSKKRFAAQQEELRMAERDLTAFTDGLYARHPDVAQARAVHTLTVKEAARLLPSDTALLEYAIRQDTSRPEGETRLALFVVTPDGKASTYDLPASRIQLKTLSSQFRALCANPHSSYQAQARQLYRLLLAPAEARLAGKKHWLICPDGPLWNVPFAALQDSKGRFVSQRHTLTFAYSATGAATALTKRTRPRPSGSVLALANPDFGDTARFGDDPHLPGQRPFDAPSRPFDAPSRPFDAPSRPFDAPSRPFDAPSRDLVLQLRGGTLKALPGTQAEADVLRRLYPDAAIYTGAKAQKATFKAEAGKYRFLHLASHAFFNDAAPMLSSIFLAAPPKSGPGSEEDGFLTARDFFDMKLNAELVTLSACQTAQGETHSGEGVIGLTWALTVAGVPTQVVSQWSVDDAATAQLMTGFYTRLKAGKGKGEALQGAATAIRHKPGYRHPYYWAPFILMGDWR